MTDAGPSLQALGPYWPTALKRVLTEQEAAILVTIVEVKGSAPRSVGSKMVVTSETQLGSIGGGNLEFQATAQAREMLLEASGSGQQHRQLYGLGPALRQCCGGAVSILFERLEDPRASWLQRLCDHAPGNHGLCLLSSLEGPMVQKRVRDPNRDLPFAALIEGLPSEGLPCVVEWQDSPYFLERVEHEQLKLVIFGAGHVATALVPMLAAHAFDISWIDSRPDQFASPSWPGVEKRTSAAPQNEVSRFAAGTLYLVMTHSHELDEDICFEVLSRNDAAWLGLIGSDAKRRRFEHRLRKRGLGEAQLAGMVCPVGMAGITGKRPATIALSICAQLLQDQVPHHWR